MPLIHSGQRSIYGRQEVIGFERNGFRVNLIAKAKADSFIRKNHYSGSVVWSSSLHFGCFFGGVLVGVAQLGPAMNPASGARVVSGSSVDSWLELNRLAFLASRPKDSGSRFLSLIVSAIRHMRPSVEWIQSFADERCGKLGAIYQACSFVYCGEHRSIFYEIDGEWFHKSALGRNPIDKRGWGCGPRIAWFNENAHRAVKREFRQFRYLRLLTNRAKKNLRLEIKPYPKPLRSVA